MKKLFKIILIIIAIIIILFGILVGIVIIDIEKQEKLLDQEIIKLQNLDLTIHEVDTTIVTKDEYAVIEKTIKDYLKDYSISGKEFLGSINTFDFKNMFTADNFKNDGPDFIESKGNLSTLKDTLNQNFDKISKMSTEEYIVSLIEEKDLDDYYDEMYKEYMFGNNINFLNETIKKDIEEIKEIIDDVNLFIDECYNLYDFMSNNRNYWEIKDNTVYFDTDKLVNQYNEHMNKIIESSNKLVDYKANNNIEDNSSNV